RAPPRALLSFPTRRSSDLGVGVHEADADALDHAVGTVVVVVPADQDGLVAVAPFLVSLHVGDRGDALGIPLGGGVVAVVEAGAADDRHRASGLHGVRLAGAVDGDRSVVVPPVQVVHDGGDGGLDQRERVGAV